MILILLNINIKKLKYWISNYSIKYMSHYKIIYPDKKEVIVSAKNAKEVVKKYDLANKSNIDTRIYKIYLSK